MAAATGNLAFRHALGILGAWSLLAPAALAIFPSLPHRLGVAASHPILFAMSSLGAIVLFAAARLSSDKGKGAVAKG